FRAVMDRHHLKETPMHFQSQNSVNEVHLLFEVMLDSNGADSDRDYNAYSKLLNKRRRGITITRQEFSKELQDTLVPMGLVALDVKSWRVTSLGHDWADMFRLHPDGTFIVFGKPVDAQAWPSFRNALQTFNSTLQALRNEISRYLT